MSVIGGINMGNLPDYLFVFTDGSTDANWQGATKGFLGDVGVDGIQASERTSGSVPYAGTIYTNDATLGAWQNIVDQNPTQAFSSLNQVALISNLENDLISAIQQIIALPPTPGFESVSSTSLDGLDVTGSATKVYVINITSGLNFSSKINITGDPDTVFILRWDTDPLTPGFQGQVKPQSGGAIVPHGGLKATNFINVAGDINASGGGTTPLAPYPQGPRYNDGLGSLIINGKDFDGGGFFTGYWLTTGKPTDLNVETGLYYGETSPLSNGIFVGGWYTITTKFSMTSGTSGVYISPNPATLNQPSIDIQKLVSADGGATFVDANTSPGPSIPSNINPVYKIIVTNNGNEALTNVEVDDIVLGHIASIPNLAIGEVYETTIVGTWNLGEQENTATAVGDAAEGQVTDSDIAYYLGTEAQITVIKEISIDGGTTWMEVNVPPGPFIPSTITPYFRITVTNTGANPLSNVTVIDDVFGLVLSIPILNPTESAIYITPTTWNSGQHVNTANASGTFEDIEYTDTDKAYYFGINNPAISIQKLVSVDDGATFIDANTPPGPKLNTGDTPQFQYIVTNIGDALLTNIVVTDDVYGAVGIIPELYPGDSESFIVIV